MTDATMPHGGVRLLRFLLIGTPGLVVSLVLAAGIFLGWFPLALSGTMPITMSVSHGTADSLLIGVGSDTSVTRLSPTDSARGAAMVDITDGQLDDLCLLVRADIPLVGRWGSLKVTSPDSVELGQVTLAASRLETGQLSTGPMVIGQPSTQDVEDLGVSGHGVFTMSSTGDDAADMNDLDADVHGLVLRDGMRLSSAAVRAAWGDQTC